MNGQQTQACPLPGIVTIMNVVNFIALFHLLSLGRVLCTIPTCVVCCDQRIIQRATHTATSRENNLQAEHTAISLSIELSYSTSSSSSWCCCLSVFSQTFHVQLVGVKCSLNDRSCCCYAHGRWVRRRKAITLRRLSGVRELPRRKVEHLL